MSYRTRSGKASLVGNKPKDIAVGMKNQRVVGIA